METIRIVSSTSSFLVVWKPAGENTAPLVRGDRESLLSRVLEQYPEIGSVSGRKPVEPGLLHRLDRETSGLVLIARTEAAYSFLREESDSLRFRKRYTAIALDVREDAGNEVPGWPFTASLPVGSSPGLPAPGAVIRTGFRPYGPGRVRTAPVVSPRSGTSLEREYETMILEAENLGRNRILGVTFQAVRFRLELLQGFRHQIRGHLAASGFPIAGDPLYLDPSRVPVFSRMHLYADGIEFRSPDDGSLVRIDLPEEPLLP